VQSGYGHDHRVRIVKNKGHVHVSAVYTDCKHDRHDHTASILETRLLNCMVPNDHPRKCAKNKIILKMTVVSFNSQEMF